MSITETKVIRLFSSPATRATRHERERVGFTLYGQAVAAARAPVFYTELAVADTLDGRFDMICLHVAVLNRRLGKATPDQAALAQAVFDAMFTDMDGCLREAGVGDLGVPRRVRAMWEAYHGRAHAYGQALDHDDAAALSAGLLRNIWRGRRDAAPQAERLAAWVRRLDAALATRSDAELAAGVAGFPTAVITRD